MNLYEASYKGPTTPSPELDEEKAQVKFKILAETFEEAVDKAKAQLKLLTLRDLKIETENFDNVVLK